MLCLAAHNNETARSCLRSHVALIFFIFFYLENWIDDLMAIAFFIIHPFNLCLRMQTSTLLSAEHTVTFVGGTQAQQVLRLGAHTVLCSTCRKKDEIAAFFEEDEKPSVEEEM